MKVSLSLIAAASLVLTASSGVASAQNKQLIELTGPRHQFDAFYSANRELLDLWSATTHTDGIIKAKLYGDPSQVHWPHKLNHRGLRTADLGRHDQLRMLAMAADTDSKAAEEKANVRACHAQTDGYINELSACGVEFTSNKFHDCWRTSSQVFAFLDKLAELEQSYFTKIPSIGKTFEGRDIPVYKISTGGDSKKKEALVGQALIHSREWQSGGAVFYIISGMLDALRVGNANVHAIFEKYDWYFVPILNIDGYEYTWTDGNRLWRKNRRTFKVGGTNYVGVDLNRNFGPTKFFNFTGDSNQPGSEIYPGPGVLSEPESAAVFNFLRSLTDKNAKLAGVIDLHMNSQAVLRPYSNQVTEAPEPRKTKLIALGSVIQETIQHGSGLEYRNVMGGTGSYLAYGTFKDAVFMELGDVPAYTLELEREDGGFITPQTSIRDVGNRTLSAFLAFSENVAAYWHT